MYRWKHNSDSSSVSLRALRASVAWILLLLVGYCVLADWQELPAWASSVLALTH